MKKKVLLGIVAAGMLMTTGCIAQTHPLTEEEQDIIAEYAAGVLLRHDENYTEALPSPTPTPTPLPTATPTPTPSPTPTPVPTGGAGDSTKVPTPGAGEEIQANADLNQVIGLAQLNAEYKGYTLMDKYSLEGNESFLIRPDAGNTLLVLDFVLENKASIPQLFDFGKQKITYQLDCNEENFLKPMITVLDHDLLYMKAEIAAAGRKECVLIFQIPKDADMTDVNLIVSREDYTEIISLDE
ncbi:MAG: hypothetical protein IJY09_01005 [Lachnospiraceae bacterium]|nr:hypothetical protein [Lachnospiraceae bacterium]